MLLIQSPKKKKNGESLECLVALMLAQELMVD